MNLVGSDASASVNGLDPLPGKVNYFLGADPSQWLTNVPTFGKVQYQNVYSGIDLIYYGNQGQLEYDFVVALGAALERHTAPERRFPTPRATWWWERPVSLIPLAGDCWAESAASVPGCLCWVAGPFFTHAYDHALPLVIDPILFIPHILQFISLLAALIIAAAYITGFRMTARYSSRLDDSSTDAEARRCGCSALLPIAD